MNVLFLLSKQDEDYVSVISPFHDELTTAFPEHSFGIVGFESDTKDFETATKEFQESILPLLNNEESIIVCMGRDVLNITLQDRECKLTSQIGKFTTIGHYTITAANSPYMHLQYLAGNTRGKNLTEHYLSLTKRISDYLDGSFKQQEIKINSIYLESDLNKVYAAIAGYAYVSLDLETIQTDWKKDPSRCTRFHAGTDVIQLNLAVTTDEAWIIKGYLLNKNVIDELTRDKILIGSNIKYDLGYLKGKYNYKKIYTGIEDVMLQSYCLDKAGMAHGLKKQCQEKLMKEDWAAPVWESLNDLNASNKNKIHTFADVPEHILVEYGAKDACYTLELFHFNKQLLKDNQYDYPFRLKATETLLEIEQNGIPLSLDTLKHTRLILEKNLQINYESLKEFPAVQEIFNEANQQQIIYDQAIAHYKFQKKAGIVMEEPTVKAPVKSLLTLNYNSPFFLRALREKTGMQVMGQTDTGEIAIDKEAIEAYSKLSEPWLYVKALRDESNLISKFLNKLEAHTINDRLHTDYRLAKVERSEVGNSNDESKTGTITGRLSSEPNVQNIPKKDVVLYSFKAPKGWVFCNFDYSQIELRVGAQLAGIKELTEDFMTGKDPHFETACYVHKREDVDKKTRNLFKRGNFLIFYGGMAGALAAATHSTVEEAQFVFDIIHKRFPEIKQYNNDIAHDIHNKGYITTPYNSKRSFQLFDGDRNHNSAVLREAGNYPIQETASNITLQKAGEVLECNLKVGYPVEVVNLVHDSIWTLCPVKFLEANIVNTMRVMCDRSTLPFQLDIPLEVKFDVGFNLAETTECSTIEEALEVINNAR